MASTFEKSVKGATKYKAAPPKSKYIEHILTATYSGEAAIAEIFRSLQHRLRDSTWTIVFKSLITTHLMIREGAPDVTLAYIASQRNILAISSFSDVQTQGRNIRHYTNYLSERARIYRETKYDFVRGARNRLEKLSVNKGLLRETEMVQLQISALLKCDVMDNEPENEITITVFRLLVLDLLSLFHTMNTGLINILGHFFEMSKIDAERALGIYKNFTKQTDFVVQYLSVARQYEHQTRVEVPKLKHAPVNLGRQLEDYLMDPEFETNRMQYLKEQDAKRNKSNMEFSSKLNNNTINASSNLINDRKTMSVKQPDSDLIDFFDSIEQSQQNTVKQTESKQNPYHAGNLAHLQTQNLPQYQQNNFTSQQFTLDNSNQFLPSFDNRIAGQHTSSHMPPNFNGLEINRFAVQIPFQPNSSFAVSQNPSAANYSPQLLEEQALSLQTSNPFRQALKPAGSLIPPILQQNSITPVTPSTNRMSTNPFANLTSTSGHPFSPPPDPIFQQSQLQTAADTGHTITGLNPFSKLMTGNTMNSIQSPQTTGGQFKNLKDTNPFRQSQLVSTTTGSGWLGSQQPIGGGLDSLETIPVFPRSMQ